jgi:SpoVK/Ycf46/Vps4 family AAA+-type ATPase
LAHEADLETGFLACLEWCADGLVPILNVVNDSLIQKPEGAVIRETLQKFAVNKSARSIAADLSEFLESHDQLNRPLKKAIESVCGGILKKRIPGRTMYSRAKELLRRLWGLNGDAVELCEFFYILQNYDQINAYFNDCLEVFRHRYPLSIAMGMERFSLEKNFSYLEDCGIINCSGCRAVEVNVSSLWETRDSCGGDIFCKPIRNKTMPLEDIAIAAGEMSHVMSLLKSENEAPLHILFYGSPGTGKSTCAASLARSLGFKAWSVPYRINQNADSGGRRTALTACLKLASGSKGAFVVLDEADRFLDTGYSFGRQTIDKAWINELLEHPGVRMIWITNNVGHIDASIKRRFTYSVHFEEPGIAERKKMWVNALQKNKAKKYLSADQIERFSRDYKTPPAVIENAVRQAKIIGGGKKEFAGIAERALRSYVSLVRNGDTLLIENKTSGEFLSEGVCVQGSIDAFFEKCALIDNISKAGCQLPPGGGTILFYGPPGTGKTALAKYLAEKFDRELIVKRSSSILSKWVGETEKNIARTFKEAEKEGAILLIDEAESFLYSREIAIRSWESSFVNEFLTSLEEYRGFCICTTNRMENLDPAAIRRFSFKLNFAYANREQAWALYNSLLAPFARGKMSDDAREKLYGMTCLAPGDFHVVKNKNWFVTHGTLSHEELIAALEAEQKSKIEKTVRRVGF